MKFSVALVHFLLGTSTIHAGVSILVEPNAAGSAVFTITQTSQNPAYNLSGIVAYALGMELPTSMFNIPDFFPGSSSNIYGSLSPALATITEFYSGQNFLLNQITVSVTPDDSILHFDPLFLSRVGAAAVRFDVTSTMPVETSISFAVFRPGVHTSSSTFFDSVRVTVVPEPSANLLLAATLWSLSVRRQRNPSHH